jgi:DNA-binding GntR family transcriptional regulator
MATTLAHRAYEHIRGKLLHGNLPPGTRLGYRPLAKEIGISATPVREAMGKLAAEGLVEVLPELGAVVRTLDRDEAIEIYQMREALETYAAGWAAKQLRETDLKELRSLWAQMRACAVSLRKSGRKLMSPATARQFATADMSFHTVILEAAGNQTLLKTVTDFQILARAFNEDPSPYDMTMVSRAYLEHGRILRALERRDAAAARRAMKRHIRDARKIVLVAFQRGRRRRRKSVLPGSAADSGLATF